MAVDGQFAYCAFENGLRIFDIEGGEFSLINEMYLGGGGHGIAYRDGYLFLADGEFGLRIIDVSDPLDPSTIGEYEIGGNAYDVFLDGGLLYLAD